MKRDNIKNKELLDDLLCPDDLKQFEAESLQLALGAARRRRARRRNAQALLLLLAPASLAALLLVRGPSDDNVAENSEPLVVRPTEANVTPSQPPVVEITIDYLSDEELLAIFPGRPVALVGAPGSQRLIFLDDIESSPATASNAQ